MARLFDVADVVGLFLVGAFLVGLMMLYANKSINLEMLIVGAIILLVFSAARVATIWWLEHLYKERYSKGKQEYWAAILKEINDTDNKYPFNYNLRLADYHMPQNNLVLTKIKLALFELNRWDFYFYNQERSTTLDYPYDYLTIVLDTETLKILDTRRKALDDVVVFLERHPEWYSDNQHHYILPEQYERFTYPTQGAVEVPYPGPPQPAQPARK